MLPGDATINDVVNELAKPESYVRGVLGNMVTYRRNVGSAVVRIGLRGVGIKPNYRIEPEMTQDLIFEEFEKYLVNFSAFNGESHAPLALDFDKVKEQNWSSKVANFESVQALIGRIRKFSSR